MLASVLQAVGLAAIAVGCFMLAPWFGIVAGGAALVLVGLAQERE